MEKRILFNLDKIRNLFFEKALKINKFNSWKSFYFNFKIPRQTLDNYRNGKITLPASIFRKINSKLDKKLSIYFEKNVSYLDSNWGRVKGGKSTYKKHKEIFDKGRKKAIKKLKEKLPKFDINLSLNKELSYFIGLFIGDGFTNKYKSHYFTQLTGNKLKEKEYYENIISTISQKLFNIIPRIKEETKDNTLRVNFYSKDLFLLITKRFGIKAGRKSRDVLIPSEILKSNSEILLSCITGIYDAEGSLYFDKRESYKKYYPVICLHMNNIKLLKQISSIFDNYNIKCSVSGNYKKLYIYGKDAVKDFLKKVRLLNTKYEKDINKLL